MTWFQDVESEFGLIKVDINTVIGKVINDVSLAAHEVDALLKWVASQGANIQAGLNAAAPIIAAVGGLATTAATGNPAAGAVVSEAITGINKAFNAAQTAVVAMNAANASFALTGGGTLANDTAAVTAGIHAITSANSSVAQLSTAALSAAQAIQKVLPA